MRLTGRFAFMTLLPLLRRYLRRTERAYVVVVCGSEILMVKNWLSRQRWQLPGGGLRKREEPASAASRELAEELGIKSSSSEFRQLTEGVWRTDGLGFRYKIFLLRLDDKPQTRLLRPEILDARWILLEDLQEAQTTIEIFGAVQLI